MSTKVYLQDAGATTAEDSVLVRDELPFFKGNEDENLACHKCKQIIGRNVSTRTIYQKYMTPNRLVVTCVCGANNVIPTLVDNSKKAS